MLDKQEITQLQQILNSEYRMKVNHKQAATIGEYLVNLYKTILTPEEIANINIKTKTYEAKRFPTNAQE